MNANKIPVTSRPKPPISVIPAPDLLSEEGLWLEDTFTECVETAMRSCFDSKIVQNPSYVKSPRDKITIKHIKEFRKIGPYISGKRDSLGGQNYGEFDLMNDTLPEKGTWTNMLYEDYDPSIAHLMPKMVRDSDIRNVYFHKVDDFPPGWTTRHEMTEKQKEYYLSLSKDEIISRFGGTGKVMIPSGNYQKYVAYDFIMAKGRVQGDRRCFYVDLETGVVLCAAFPYLRSSHYAAQPDEAKKVVQKYHDIYSVDYGMMLQLTADKKFTWAIRAQKKKAAVDIACSLKEVGSLLYARDLPLTDSGRKRPIIHLVRAHQRRMKDKLPIDIRQFLRGTQEVSVGDTTFTVQPPIGYLSDYPTSQKYFETLKLRDV